MGHHCCSKQKVKRGLWSPEEDEKLFNYITTHGHGSWSSVPKLAGLQRCGKSCRLRWINYLRPDLKKGSFTEEEERTIIEVHRILGNRWAQIAKHLPGRTDNEVKNFWNSCIKKKLLAQGLDPNTHNLLPSSQKHLKRAHNNALKSTIPHHIPPNSGSLVFSVDPISDQDYIMKNDIETCFSTSSIVDLGHANNFVWSAKDNTQNPNAIPDNSVSLISPNGYNMVDDQGSLWSTQSLESFEQPIGSDDQMVIHPPEEMTICDMEAEYELRNLQNLDATLNSQCFDFGFGDYSPTMMPSCLYGDMTSPMDHVAWDNC
ncbi:hypothetical protein Cgig2_029207 [Carnegiea gigantea]|uniref:Uncharacterized protein n=1 Tax=Carnegiea gigantea TaxID=171969 RepID=A0A9Q1KKH2_9CARY|nr:hypothetical protein Cgig2_029207 [Carnegiea gigantea]